MWFWLWAGLILAWLASAFFLLRWLWRRAKDLMRAIDEAAEVTEHLDSGTWAPAQLPPVAIFATAADLSGRRHQRRDRIASRRARRRARDQAVYDRWAVLAGYRDA
ncbi:MAG: hypothetical protein LBD90_05260 [Bifidobacteriaceae bacterium]|nr:hypothetical protein [Bifidobacteriaceae bacterium]